MSACVLGVGLTSIRLGTEMCFDMNLHVKRGLDGREISRTLKEVSNHFRLYQAASKVDTDQRKKPSIAEMSKVHMWPYIYQDSTVKVVQRPGASVRKFWVSRQNYSNFC